MGNSKSSANTKYIAKETFYPSEMDFYNFPLIQDGTDYDKKAYQLRIENPLRITVDDELELFGNVELVGTDGTRLQKMKNVRTNDVGLVIADCVKKTEAVEEKLEQQK